MISMKNSAGGVKKELLRCMKKNNFVSNPQYMRRINHSSSKIGRALFTFLINQFQVNQLSVLLEHETFECLLLVTCSRSPAT